MIPTYNRLSPEEVARARLYETVYLLNWTNREHKRLEKARDCTVLQRYLKRLKPLDP